VKAAPPRRSRSVAADVARAMALHREGRLDEAEALYRGVLRADPAQFDALHLLGVVEGQHGRFEAALPLLERAVALRPDNAAALNNLGNTLAGLRRHADAVTRYEQALALRSGNPRALRNRGTSLRRLGRLDEAMQSFEQALAIDPTYADAVISRAELLQQMRRTTEAIAAFRAALALDGTDTVMLHYALAALGAEPTPAGAPAGYVRALFDGYADEFDTHLVEELKYRGPALVAAALRQAAPTPGQDVVDLGCGTGLCGPLLRPLARRLVGVDLSAGMLALARRGGCYDELVEAELVAWLAGQPAAFDCAVAADVLIYLGDLDPALAALRQALRPRGILACTLEATPADGYALKPSRRYGHSVGYLHRLAARHGCTVEAIEPAVLREDAENDVDGHVVVLRRSP
jgi:predicted TPR repeat methyltransferase